MDGPRWLRGVRFILRGAREMVSQIFSRSRSVYYAPGSVPRSADAPPRWAIVTGANGGIGTEIAKGLVRDGVSVVLACRSETDALRTKKDVEECVQGRSTVHSIPLDLSSFRSIQSFVRRFEEMKVPLHILVNNAAVMSVPAFTPTEDGFETQMGVNHVGHFLLTALLLPKLESSGGAARVVFVSSIAHEYTTSIDWNVFRSHPHYSPAESYAQSKLANVMTTYELERRYRARGIRFYAVHPGVVRTNITRHLVWPLPFIAKWLGHLMFRTPADGALTVLHCALSPDLDNGGGKYYADGVATESSPASYNEEMAHELVDRSFAFVKDFL